jgi:hypothetical protein
MTTLVGIGSTPTISPTADGGALAPIPPAALLPPGSMVLLSTSGTDKTDLVLGSLFWLAVAFAGGILVGRYTKKG